jgi:hypothetical protein
VKYKFTLLMKLNILIPFVILALNGSLLSQPFQNVLIDNTGGPEEPSICINPKNTNFVVAGANINSYYYSSNGGFNWTEGTLTGTYQVWGDPCISVDTAGNFYFYHLTNGSYFIDRMGMHKSTNNGVSYGIQSYWQYNPPRAEQDKEWAAVDWTHGPRGNWIYVTWTQFDRYNSSLPTDSSRILFTRSTNGGLNWLDTSTIISRKSGTCIDDDNTMEGAVPCVGPNGEIYVGWAGPKIINSQFGIFFNKSTDGGNTWLANEIYVADQPGGWDYNINGIYRANGLPITCCDVSNGPHRGTIYINWTDQAGTNDHDVKIAKSTNGGLNWSAPIRVNNDPAGKEQFFTWMTIDQTTGFLYFVFYDRRNYSDNLTTDVFMARSTDGGATFTNTVISSSPFVPNQSTFFGDYTNITAANGKIRPIWTRLQGSLSVWTAIIDFPVAIENQNNKIPESYSLSQNFPNPFNPSTTIKFTIPKNSHDRVTLKVYDILGKEIAVLVNEALQGGTYQINWNAANFSSGLYFYKLNAGSFTDTRKMILSK